ILYQNGPNVYTSVIPSSENYTRLLLWLRFGDPSPTLPVVPGTKDPSPYGTYYSTIQNNDVDLNKVRANVAAIHAAAQVQLGIQKTLVLNPDPQGVIADWSVRDKNTASAGEIMRRFVSYLKGLEKNWIDHPEWFADSYGQRDQVAVVQQTRDRFEKTLGILESKIPDKEKLIGIFSVMDLQEQDQVITGRLNEIVQMDLEKRLRLGLLSDAKNLETTIRLATEDLFTSLYPNSVNFLTKIKEDLGEAEVIAKSNLKNFYDFFKDPILRAMEDLAKDSKTWGENESGAFQKKISKLCILILNAPQLDDGDFSNLVNVCRKAEMKETFENSVVSVSFDQLYSHYSGEPEKRMCAYRRFRNQVDLKEILEQRPIKYNSSK
ncbi:MAG: hypothetical protein JWQ35_1448, partial [Bacteriovoracaceae bacterium]|nr:hypothetical protein [Bacteriovoracaceae bacterium]